MGRTIDEKLQPLKALGDLIRELGRHPPEDSAIDLAAAIVALIDSRVRINSLEKDTLE